MSIEQSKFPQFVETSHQMQALVFTKNLSKEQTNQLENLFAQAFNVGSTSKA